jgi:hypothetical protein
MLQSTTFQAPASAKFAKIIRGQKTVTPLWA